MNISFPLILDVFILYSLAPVVLPRPMNSAGTNVVQTSSFVSFIAESWLRRADYLHPPLLLPSLCQILFRRCSLVLSEHLRTASTVTYDVTITI